MKNIIIAQILIFVILLAGCDKSADDTERKINITKSTEELIKSDNEFGMILFKKIADEIPDNKNIVVSPVSAALALAMTYNGANGATKDSMEIALMKSGMETSEINQSYKDLMEGLKSIDQKVTLDIANSIWYRTGFEVLPDFIQTNINYYNAEVRSLDFANPQSLETINNWVAENTNDKITEIINQIPADAVMYLINAIYFYGTWKYEFDDTKTAEKDFYLSDQNTVKVDMMMQDAELNYMHNDDFSAVELPYGSEHYSMVVLLPNGQKNTGDIIEQLNPGNWNSWIESMAGHEIVLSLPKFKFEFEDSLNNVLSKMGMGIAFSHDFADFSKINPLGNLYISMVKQKAYIDVNEKGTEAAAVTVVEINYTSASVDDKIYFTVNKPFLFVIMEKSSKSIIFIGRVMEPKYES